MAKGPRQKLFSGQFEWLAFDILSAHGDALGASDLFAETRQAEASFFAGLKLFLAYDLGIDQNDLLGRVFRDRKVDNGDALRNANLRSGEAHALGGVHGLEHVL